MSYLCHAFISWRCVGRAKILPFFCHRSLLPDKQHTWLRLWLHTACLDKIERWATEKTFYKVVLRKNELPEYSWVYTKLGKVVFPTFSSPQLRKFLIYILLTPAFFHLNLISGNVVWITTNNKPIYSWQKLEEIQF